MNETRVLEIDRLRPGDILFSTTAGKFSELIKAATASRFSHASIYVGDGIIVEANDDGVAPRAIVPTSLGAHGGVAGLPYDDWLSVAVLRLTRYDAEEWKSVITATLREHLGLDYPKVYAITQGESLTKRLMLAPVAKLYDAYEWLQNKEPVAYDAWCSRLVAFVLLTQLSHKLTPRQRAALEHANPQRLYEIACQIGYSEIDDCLSEPVQVSDEQFEHLRRQFKPIQDAAMSSWRQLRDAQRAKVLEEQKFSLIRRALKLLQAGLALVVLVVVATIGARNFGSERITATFMDPVPTSPRSAELLVRNDGSEAAVVQHMVFTVRVVNSTIGVRSGIGVLFPVGGARAIKGGVSETVRFEPAAQGMFLPSEQTNPEFVEFFKSLGRNAEGDADPDKIRFLQMRKAKCQMSVSLKYASGKSGDVFPTVACLQLWPLVKAEFAALTPPR